MLISWLWDRLRGSLWLIPSLLMTSAAGMAFAVLWIDHHYVEDNPAYPIGWLFGGGAEGAREVLSSVAGASVTIAGVVFSITVVALTLASEQFGPRVLRNFMRDIGNQVVLGTFVSVHLYCLLVLRSVRAPEAGGFIPHASVAVVVLLAVAAVIVLVYFFHHLTASLQASHIIAAIAGDLSSAIDEHFPDRVTCSGPLVEEPPVTPIGPHTGVCIASTRSGYLQTIDVERIVNLAEEHDLTIAMASRPGNFVTRDHPLAYAVSSEQVPDTVRVGLNKACTLGEERTGVQDVAFPVHQLTEIAVRALSQSTNDHPTALACIDRLGAAFVQLACRRLPSASQYDRRGRLRLITRSVRFRELVSDSFGQIRQYGLGSGAIMLRLLNTIAGIAPYLTTVDQWRALNQQALLVYEGSRQGIPLAQDQAEIRERYHAVRTALQRSGSAMTVERVSS